jgi:diguanylate cyclase (GGDEF)-like protein
MPSGPDEDELLDESTLEVTVSRDMRGIIEHSSKEQALLIVLSEPRLGARLLLAEAPIEIGRGTAGGLVLDADSVSRRHARVEWTGRAHRLVDQDSTNGTFVNGVRITSQELKDGDRVQIGKVLLKYIAGGNIETNYHEEVQRLMRYDALTGVYNKRHFEECLRVAVHAARANPRRLSLVVFDLDHFKKINDTHGHVAGDVVLCELAKVAREVLSGDVVFGRVGGEEFAALLEGAELSTMVELAEKMRKATASHPFSYEGAKLGVTISAGVAERVADGDEPAAALYDRADAKLYEAKEAGRNCVKA